MLMECPRIVSTDTSAAADLSFTPKLNDQVVIGVKTYQVVFGEYSEPV
jgi:hypothetical protein